MTTTVLPVLPVPATLRTAALLVELLGIEQNAVAVDVRVPGSAGVHLFGPPGGCAGWIEHAAEVLGVQAKWQSRTSAAYPLQYVAAGFWRGVEVTVFALFSAEEADDVRRSL